MDSTPNGVKIMGKHKKKKDSLSVEEIEIEPIRRKRKKDREAL